MQTDRRPAWADHAALAEAALGLVAAAAADAAAV